MEPSVVCRCVWGGLMKRYHSLSYQPSQSSTLKLHCVRVRWLHHLSLTEWKVTCGQTDWTHRAAVKIQLMTDKVEKILTHAHYTSRPNHTILKRISEFNGVHGLKVPYCRRWYFHVLFIRKQGQVWYTCCGSVEGLTPQRDAHGSCIKTSCQDVCEAVMSQLGSHRPQHSLPRPLTLSLSFLTSLTTQSRAVNLSVRQRAELPHRYMSRTRCTMVGRQKDKIPFHKDGNIAGWKLKSVLFWDAGAVWSSSFAFTRLTKLQ